MKLYDRWFWHELKHKGSKGFTLVELLVVLVIAGVIAMISVPASINLNRRIRLSGAQSEILRAARTAQSNSRRFGERWNVTLFESGGRVFTAAFPGGNTASDTLFNASPDDATTFYSRCAQVKRTCIRTELDRIVAIDRTGSNFANTCSWGSYCRRISFLTDGGDENSNVDARFQIRDVNVADGTFPLCVRTSSRLGVIRIEC